MLALPGISSCSVSVTTGRASITFRSGGGGSGGSGGVPSSLESGIGAKGGGGDGGSSGARDVVRAVEGLGYGAKVRVRPHVESYNRDGYGYLRAHTSRATLMRTHGLQTETS